MPDQLENESDVLAAVRRTLRSGVAGREVAEAMASLIAETSRLSLNNLEAWEGKLRSELWENERRPSPARWNFSKPVNFVSWLDLCSGDGFKREGVLRTLSEGFPNGFVCSLAMRRLNDWVPQVRAAARQQLPLVVERSDPEVVVDTLWHMLPNCSSWGRTGDADRQVLTDLITIGQVAVALKSRIVAAPAGPATSVLTQAGRAPVLDQWLGEIAKNAIQPSVRAKAYRSQLEGRMVWVAGRKWAWTDSTWCQGRFEPVLGERLLSVSSPFRETLNMASVDRSPMVRRVAGEVLIQHLETVGAGAVKLAEQLASDRFPSVAERGRFALAKIGGHT